MTDIYVSTSSNPNPAPSRQPLRRRMVPPAGVMIFSSSCDATSRPPVVYICLSRKSGEPCAGSVTRAFDNRKAGVYGFHQYRHHAIAYRPTESIENRVLSVTSLASPGSAVLHSGCYVLLTPYRRSRCEAVCRASKAPKTHSFFRLRHTCDFPRQQAITRIRLREQHSLSTFAVHDTGA